jgi:hypothetical protein
MKLTRRHNNRFGQRWSVLDWFDIPNPAGDETYLKRLRLIQTPWFGIYVHWINLPDSDPDLHDHPWNFTSTILRGGYVESAAPISDPSKARIKAWSRWSTHRMTQDQCHKIVILAPDTVTLIFVGRRRGSWGFYTPNGYVPHEQYERGQ